MEQLLSFAAEISREGVYTSEELKKCFKEREKELLKHKIPKFNLSSLKYLDDIVEELSRLSRLETVTEDDLNSLKLSNERLLMKIIYNCNDTEIQRKLPDMITYIHRRIVMIHVKKSIKELVAPIIKTLEELKKPGMSAKTKLFIAIALVTVGVLTGVCFDMFNFIEQNIFFFKLPLCW